MRNILILLTLISSSSCEFENTIKSSDKTEIVKLPEIIEDDVNHYEIAEKLIKELKSKEAISHLKKVKSDDPNYKKAQELLKTVDAIYGTNNSNSTNNESENVLYSIEDSITLSEFQEDFCREQIKLYHNYLMDFQIVGHSSIEFILSKDASQNGSLSSHEKLHIPTLTKRYIDQIKELDLPIADIDISFKRKDGFSNSSLFTSEKGWLPAQYLWYDVVLYYGEGAEKKYIGIVKNGRTILDEKYVVIEYKSGHIENKKLDHIKNSYYFIKADDPSVSKRVLNFKS
jgi:hypothetical protein